MTVLSSASAGVPGRRAGLLIALSSAFLFGAQAIAISFASAAGLGTGSIIFLRGLCVSAFSLAACLTGRQTLRIGGRQLRRLLVYAVFSVGTSFLLILSYRLTGTGVATTIHFVYPLLVILTNTVVFRVKTPATTWVALAVVLAAMWFMQDTSGAMPWTGVLTAFLSACFWSAGMLWYERSGLSGTSPLVVSFYLYLAHAPAGLIYALATREPLSAIPAGWYLALLPALFVFLASCLFQVGIRSVGTGLCSILGIGEPLTTLVLGWLLLGETLSVRTWVCCGALLAAILLVMLRIRPASDGSGQA